MASLEKRGITVQSTAAWLLVLGETFVVYVDETGKSMRLPVEIEGNVISFSEASIAQRWPMHFAVKRDQKEKVFGRIHEALQFAGYVVRNSSRPVG